MLFTVSDKIAAKSADELEAEIRGWGPEFLPADHDLRPYELAQFLAQLIYSQRLNRPTPTFDGDWLLILRQYHEDLNEWEMRQNA